MFLNTLVRTSSKLLDIMCGPCHPNDRDFEVSATGHSVKRRKNLLIRQISSCAEENKCVRFETLHFTLSFSMQGPWPCRPTKQAFSLDLASLPWRVESCAGSR